MDMVLARVMATVAGVAAGNNTSSLHQKALSN